jgi:DNA-binding transcriptional regulator LsrR (DeoR family)
MRTSNPELNQKRMMTKVAHLYHSRGMVQTEIARVLGLSQARISRLLAAAAEANIIKTVVVPPQGLFAELETELEVAFGLQEVHVVDPISNSVEDLSQSLGQTLASVFQISPIDGKIVGISLSNAIMEAFVGCLDHFPHAKAKAIVQLQGALGTAAYKHDFDVATTRLAALTSSTAVFLRSPAIAPSQSARDVFAEFDLGTSSALNSFENLDSVILEIARGKDLGGCALVNQRLLSEGGTALKSDRDDLLLAASLTQLQNASRRVGIGGGEMCHQAILATLRSGLMNVLVTDYSTAEFLLENVPN